MDNISKLPSVSDRTYTRVNAKLYLHSEHYSPTRGPQHDSKGLFMAPFAEEQDDVVGLSIDAFWEKVSESSVENKDLFLELQQILAMLKRAEKPDPMRGTHKSFKKLNVNISGSGIAFPSDVAYHAGQLLRLSLFFPKKPFSYITVIVEVVRSEKAEIGYDIKCRYKEISDDIREEILAFVS
ncbi:MAG: hypothetical protein ACD_62C00376G0003 [uncultured bacterium]|nr:MAG: hypothetical protein ACD_62C00376G0003 [uncultured bacterium]HLD44222.1 PilZ domain-containing protein [bacterium]